MTNTPNNTAPESNEAVEQERKLSVREQQLLADTAEKLSTGYDTLLHDYMNLSPETMATDLEETVLSRHPDMPADALRSALTTAMAALLQSDVRTQAELQHADLSTWSLSRLMSHYIFFPQDPTATNEYWQRIIGIQRFFMNNVYCVRATTEEMDDAKEKVNRRFGIRKALEATYEDDEPDFTSPEFAVQTPSERASAYARSELPAMFLDAPIIVEKLETEAFQSAEYDETNPAAINGVYMKESTQEVLGFNTYVSDLRNLFQMRFREQLQKEPVLRDTFTIPEGDVFAHEWFQEATHGAERQNALKNIAAERTFRNMVADNAFDGAGDEVKTMMEGVLNGDPLLQNKHLREASKDAVKNAQKAFDAVDKQHRRPDEMAPTSVLFEGDDDDDVLECLDVLYDQMLNKPFDVRARLGAGNGLVMANNLLRNLDSDADDIEEAISDVSLDDAKLFANQIAISGDEITQAVRRVKNLVSPEKLSVLRGALGPEAFTDTTYSVRFKLMDLYDEMDLVDFEYARLSAGTKLFLAEKCDFLLGTQWQTDPDDFGDMMDALRAHMQQEVMLSALKTNLLTPEADLDAIYNGLLDTNRDVQDAVFLTEDALALEQTVEKLSVPGNTDGGLMLESALRVLDDEIDKETANQTGATTDAEKAKFGAKIEALEKLKEQLTSGGLTLKDIEALSSLIDPNLVPSADTLEALEAIGADFIAAQADKFATDQLHGNIDPTGLTHEEIERLYGDNLHEDLETEREMLKTMPRARIQGILENLADPEFDLGGMDEALELLKEAFDEIAKTKNELPGSLTLPKLARNMWYRVSGVRKVKTPVKTKRNAKIGTATIDTKEKIDFFAEITSIDSNRVRFGANNTSVPTKSFLFHIINTAFEPGADDMNIQFVRDGVENPVDSQETLEELVPDFEGWIAEGNLLKKGNEVYGSVRKVTKEGIQLEYKNPEGKRCKDDLSWIEIMLMNEFEDPKYPLRFAPPNPEDVKQMEQGRSVNPLSLHAIGSIGKAIFTGELDTLKDKNEMRLTLQRLAYFKRGSRFDSLWSKTQEEMVAKEEDIAKKYRAKLENLQSNELEVAIHKEMKRFEPMKDLNIYATGSKFTDITDIGTGNKPSFIRRAELKALFIFTLENYGSLYPFKSLDEFRVNNFWTKKFRMSNAAAKEGAQYSVKARGEEEGRTELWLLQGIFRAQPDLYGDAFAAKMESAYYKGQDHAKKNKESALKVTQSGGQIKDILVDAIRNHNWAGVQECFRKMSLKEIPSEEMFNMFLFTYVELCRDKSGRTVFPPQIGYEEIQEIGKAVFVDAPEIYFFFFKSPESFKSLHRHLMDPRIVTKYGNYQNFQWSDDDKVPVPFHNGEKSNIYKAFTLEGDYTFLDGYAEATEDLNKPDQNHYVVFLQTKGNPAKPVTPETEDWTMWGQRSILLYFNPKKLKELVRNQMTTSGLATQHSREYITQLMRAVEELKNAPESEISTKDKEAFLNMIRKTFYDEVYTSMSFRPIPLNRNTSRDRDGNVMKGLVDDPNTRAAQERDSFMSRYYAGLKKAGLSVQECADAAGFSDQDMQGSGKKYIESDDTVNFQDRRKYLVLDVSTETENFYVKERARNLKRDGYDANDSYYDSDAQPEAFRQHAMV